MLVHFPLRSIRHIIRRDRRRNCRRPALERIPLARHSRRDKCRTIVQRHRFTTSAAVCIEHHCVLIHRPLRITRRIPRHSRRICYQRPTDCGCPPARKCVPHPGRCRECANRASLSNSFSRTCRLKRTSVRIKANRAWLCLSPLGIKCGLTHYVPFVGTLARRGVVLRPVTVPSNPIAVKSVTRTGRHNDSWHSTGIDGRHAQGATTSILLIKSHDIRISNPFRIQRRTTRFVPCTCTRT